MEAEELLEGALQVLTSTMEHGVSKMLFNVAVDPVALDLPDYLDVIKEPMVGMPACPDNPHTVMLSTLLWDNEPGRRRHVPMTRSSYQWLGPGRTARAFLLWFPPWQGHARRVQRMVVCRTLAPYASACSR